MEEDLHTSLEMVSPSTVDCPFTKFDVESKSQKTKKKQSNKQNKTKQRNKRNENGAYVESRVTVVLIWFWFDFFFNLFKAPSSSSVGRFVFDSREQTEKKKSTKKAKKKWPSSALPGGPRRLFRWPLPWQRLSSSSSSSSTFPRLLPFVVPFRWFRPAFELSRSSWNLRFDSIFFFSPNLT